MRKPRGFSLHSTFYILHSLIFLLAFTSGCGYTSRSLIKTHADTIFVETFRNKIDITEEVTGRKKYKVYRPFLEKGLTNAVIERLRYDGNLKVVKRQKAGLLLRGEVTEYIREPLKYSDAKTIDEYRLSLVVNFTVEDEASGKIVLNEEGLTGDATYFTAGRLAKSEESAREALFEDLARRLVNRVVYQW